MTRLEPDPMTYLGRSAATGTGASRQDLLGSEDSVTEDEPTGRKKNDEKIPPITLQQSHQGRSGSTWLFVAKVELDIHQIVEEWTYSGAPPRQAVEAPSPDPCPVLAVAS